MPTRPATLRSEKAGSFSAWASRLARKVSPKSKSTRWSLTRKRYSLREPFSFFTLPAKVFLQQEEFVPDLPAQRERQGVQLSFDFVGENDGVAHGELPNRFPPSLPSRVFDAVERLPARQKEGLLAFLAKQLGRLRGTGPLPLRSCRAVLALPGTRRRIGPWLHRFSARRV